MKINGPSFWQRCNPALILWNEWDFSCCATRGWTNPSLCGSRSKQSSAGSLETRFIIFTTRCSQTFLHGCLRAIRRDWPKWLFTALFSAACVRRLNITLPNWCIINPLQTIRESGFETCQQKITIISVLSPGCEVRSLRDNFIIIFPRRQLKLTTLEAFYNIRYIL